MDRTLDREDNGHPHVMELEMLNSICFGLFVCVVRTSEVVLFVECIRHRTYLLHSVQCCCCKCEMTKH